MRLHRDDMRGMSQAYRGLRQFTDGKFRTNQRSYTQLFTGSVKLWAADGPIKIVKGTTP